MDKGLAKNTAAVQQYLDRCPIVIEYREHPDTPEYLDVDYDGIEGVDIGSFPGVWWEEETMSISDADTFCRAKKRAQSDEYEEA